MKVKLKDGWELDKIILTRDTEKIIFQYDPIEDKLVKITETDEKELKGLFDWHEINASTVTNHPPNSPNISKKQKGRPKKIDIKTIKEIKELAQLGMDNKDIAKKLLVSVPEVRYWRLNTPKDLNAS